MVKNWRLEWRYSFKRSRKILQTPDIDQRPITFFITYYINRSDINRIEEYDEVICEKSSWCGKSLLHISCPGHLWKDVSIRSSEFFPEEHYFRLERSYIHEEYVVPQGKEVVLCNFRPDYSCYWRKSSMQSRWKRNSLLFLHPIPTVHNGQRKSFLEGTSYSVKVKPEDLATSSDDSPENKPICILRLRSSISA